MRQAAGHASRIQAELLSAFERHLLAASMRPKTIATYLRIVGLFESEIAPRALREAARADVEAFLARPRRTGAPAATATRNLELIALRRFFCALGGTDPTSQFQLKRPERRDPAVPMSEQLRAIFIAAAVETHPERTLAIVALLFQAGWSRSAPRRARAARAGSPLPAGSGCTDGNACTVDMCDGAGTCATTPNAACRTCAVRANGACEFNAFIGQGAALAPGQVASIGSVNCGSCGMVTVQVYYDGSRCWEGFPSCPAFGAWQSPYVP